MKSYNHIPRWEVVDYNARAEMSPQCYYDAIAAQFDDVYNHTGAFAEGDWPKVSSEINSLTEILVGLTPQHVDDLGCGTGFWSSLVARKASTITLYDCSTNMMRIAEHKIAALAPNVNINTHACNIMDQSFSLLMPHSDLAILAFVLSHYPTTESVDLIKRLSRQSRALLIVDSTKLQWKEPDHFVLKRHRVGETWISVRKRYPTMQQWMSLFQASDIRIGRLISTKRFFAVLSVTEGI